MSLTRDNLKTILQFGIHIAKVDGEFVVWEKQVLARFAEAMRLTDAERAQMVGQELSLASGLNSLTDQDARQLLVKTLCAVAHSDGVSHPSELDFINKVIQQIGSQLFVLPKDEWGSYEQEVMDAIHAVMDSGA